MKYRTNLRGCGPELEQIPLQRDWAWARAPRHVAYSFSRHSEHGCSKLQLHGSSATTLLWILLMQGASCTCQALQTLTTLIYNSQTQNLFLFSSISASRCICVCKTSVWRVYRFPRYQFRVSTRVLKEQAAGPNNKLQKLEIMLFTIVSLENLFVNNKHYIITLLLFIESLNISYIDSLFDNLHNYFWISFLPN